MSYLALRFVILVPPTTTFTPILTIYLQFFTFDLLFHPAHSQANRSTTGVVCSCFATLYPNIGNLIGSVGPFCWCFRFMFVLAAQIIHRQPCFIAGATRLCSPQRPRQPEPVANYYSF